MEKALSLEGFATKEIALTQKPIKDLLKEYEGVVIDYSKSTVKKKLTDLVKKHQKEIDELIELPTLTVKQENRLIELRKPYKDSRIALDKITKHNSSVFAQASKKGKEVKDELTPIIEPVEDKISSRLEKEQKRREDAAEQKRIEEEQRIEKIKKQISELKQHYQNVIDETKEYSDIVTKKARFQQLIDYYENLFETGELNFEEFKIDYDTMLTTLSEAFQNVITNLTNAHQLEVQNRALEVQKLTNERMSELFDYGFKYKGEISLGELSLEEYAEVLIPERTKFRIIELEKLGFIKSNIEESYIYTPNDSLVLLTTTIEKIRNFSDYQWNIAIQESKKEIENYQEPTPVNEIEVIEDKEIEHSGVITGNYVHTQTESFKRKVVEESVKITEKPKTIEMMVFKDLQEKGFSEIFREMIIQTYNDCQSNLLSHFDKESLVYREVESAINELEAIEYFENKFN